MAKLPIPFGNPSTYPGHSGVDFGQPRGARILASGPGRVTSRSRNDGGGFYIWVQYDNGPEVGYHHMDNHNGCPSVGSRVDEGTLLGYVGNSGNSTGPHLHSEVAGHRSTAGYWQFFDSSRVVGQSGGGSNSELALQQQFLISRGYDLGASGADGFWGPKTEAAIKAYQQYLKDRGWYSGDIDGNWGPGTQAAHAIFYAEIHAPAPAQGWPVFPLPSGKYFGPEAGGDNSISGWHSFNDALKVWQQRMADRGWPIIVDGYYGPRGASTPQGNTAEVALAFQREKGYTPDSLIGKETWDGAWNAPVTPATPTPAPPIPAPTPEPGPTPGEATEESATPSLVSPTAEDFPSWIRFEVKLDEHLMAKPDWNLSLQKYYGKPYNPIESHTHWWGEPGKAGSHDGNVDYLNRTADVGANFVTSAGRVTLTCPLNKNAVTTGQRNPFAWKTENDPLITTSTDDLGYKTLGYLHYIVEKLNPHLVNEPIRLHKEFNATSCSNIDKAKVRAFAEAFRTGALDPETGLPPVDVTPDPTPDPEPTPSQVLVDRRLLEEMRDAIDEVLNEKRKG